MSGARVPPAPLRTGRQPRPPRPTYLATDSEIDPRALPAAPNAGARRNSQGANTTGALGDRRVLAQNSPTRTRD